MKNPSLLTLYEKMKLNFVTWFFVNLRAIALLRCWWVGYWMTIGRKSW